MGVPLEIHICNEHKFSFSRIYWQWCRARRQPDLAHKSNAMCKLVCISLRASPHSTRTQTPGNTIYEATIWASRQRIYLLFPRMGPLKFGSCLRGAPARINHVVWVGSISHLATNWAAAFLHNWLVQLRACKVANRCKVARLDARSECWHYSLTFSTIRLVSGLIPTASYERAGHFHERSSRQDLEKVSQPPWIDVGLCSESRAAARLSKSA